MMAIKGDEDMPYPQQIKRHPPTSPSVLPFVDAATQTDDEVELVDRYTCTHTRTYAHTHARTHARTHACTDLLPFLCHHVPSMLGETQSMSQHKANR